MEFEIPTTKEELTATLEQLFDYYHHYKGEYEGQPLETLNLDKMVFNEKSESVLREELTALMAKKQAAESAEKCAPYKVEYEKYSALYNAEDEEAEALLLAAEEEYRKKLERLVADAAERNLAQSSAYLSLRAELETEFENKNNQISRESAARKAERPPEDALPVEGDPASRMERETRFLRLNCGDACFWFAFNRRYAINRPAGIWKTPRTGV